MPKSSEEGSSASGKPRVKKTSLACNSCRRKKQKCSGLPAPCSACAVLETTCCFDETLDRRRRDSRRTQVDLEFRSVALKQILTLLRNGDVAELCRVVQCAKQGQTDAQLLSTILNGATQQDSPFLSGKYYEFNLTSASISEEGQDRSLEQSPIDRISKAETIDSQILPSLRHRSTSVPSVSYDEPQNLGAATFHGSSLDPTFQNGKQFFENLADVVATHQFNNQTTATSGMSVPNNRNGDTMSKAMNTFRTSVQQEIARQADIQLVLGTRRPHLTLPFGTSAAQEAHCVWDWASELAKSHHFLPFSMQLAIVYFVGIQMRFLVHPCQETFDDMPDMLRSSMEYPGTFTTFPLDPWQVPQLSIHRLDASIGGPANPVYVGQSCNWPYSDAACLNSSSGDRVLTMSQAFIEHVTCLKNWSSRDSIMPAPANSF